MNGRVLVTGAGGFIGQPTCEALVRRGFEVHAAVTPRSSVSGASVHHVDLMDGERVDELVAELRPTHLVHLAWITTPQYWTSLENLKWAEASLHLVDAFRRYGGKRLVVAGSCAEYDWTTGGRCHEAETRLAPATLYGTAKHALHLLLDAYCRAANLSFAWGRVFFAYGPGEREMRLVPSVIRALLAREHVPCTDGEQQRDFMYVTDLGDAFAALLASEVSGAVNVGSGEAQTLKHVVSRIAAKLDGNDLIDLGALPQRAGDPSVLVADTTRLRTEVRWQPRIALDDGLDLTIAWWRSKARP